VPQLTGQLSSDSPIVDVHIAVESALEQALRRHATAVPSPFPVRALLDTGSTGCCIRTGTASRLGIGPIGTTHIVTGSRVEVALVYLLRVILPGDHEFEFKFAEIPMPASTLECLLGQEFLTRGTFTQNGPLATWSFDW
jgi:hypothetical protein